MEDEKEAVQEEENPDTGTETDDEDLLYTHKPESRDSGMRWNNTLCRKPGR
ncbi:hypothetical protein [Methanosarcina sp. KYL-1]|uniref:hypothetical protein n=1 Tax=Methanosarcina sp. KYL-1 TaxID=2602068 RepID=UPI00210097E0|nr:hypothetical protein [Methanosarcina sp. KYL-1]